MLSKTRAEAGGVLGTIRRAASKTPALFFAPLTAASVRGAFKLIFVLTAALSREAFDTLVDAIELRSQRKSVAVARWWLLIVGLGTAPVFVSLFVRIARTWPETSTWNWDAWSWARFVVLAILFEVVYFVTFLRLNRLVRRQKPRKRARKRD